jgi:hypothetical protein
MHKHVPSAAAALSLFLALWYLPPIGSIFLIWMLEGGSDLWRFGSLLAFAVAGAVLGLAAASTGASRLPAVLAGLPLAVIGVVGAWSEEGAVSVGRLLPAIPGLDVEGTTTQSMSTAHSLIGGHLLPGVILLAAALRPVRRRSAGRVRSVLIGLAVIALAWSWVMEVVWRDSWHKPLGLAAAGAVAGALASAALLSRWGPAVGGLPLLGFGIWGFADLSGYDDFTYTAKDFLLVYPFFHDGYEFREGLVAIIDLNVLVGAALVAAALVPWRGRVRPSDGNGREGLPSSAGTRG